MQTDNFGVEFGGAGNGSFNVVTKSGTNDLYGTLLWRYQSQSQRFNSVSNVDKLNGTPKVFSHNVYGFTPGGPVRSDKTFFLRSLSTGHAPIHYELLYSPSNEAAVARLRANYRVTVIVAETGKKLPV